MKINKTFYLFLLAIPLFAFSTHKFYLSLTKIDYIKESKSVQITMRIFIDDIENDLNKIYGKEFKLDSKNELKNANEYITKYITDQFKVKINGELKTFNYLGKKYENDVVYLFSEISNIVNIEFIEIQNHILMEMFPEQQNIIKLNINNKKKSFILTSKNDKDLLSF